MRWIRPIALAVVTFLVTLVSASLSPGTFLNQALAIASCTIFSFNSTQCSADFAQSSDRVVAATPSVIETLSRNDAPSELLDTPQLSQATPANNSRNSSPALSGIWKRTGTTFTADDQGCSAGYTGQLTVNGKAWDSGIEFTVTQEGDRLSIPNETVGYSSDDGKGSYIITSGGIVSGNQVRIVYTGGGFTTEFTGKISDDGNTITGETVCQFSGGSAIATGTLSWTRKSEGVAGQIDVPRDSEALRRRADRQAFERAFKQADVNEAARLFEAYQTEEFKKYLGIDSPVKIPSVGEISQTLDKIYKATGKKPAVLQAVSLQDRADLILILPGSASTAIKEESPTTGLVNARLKTAKRILGQPPVNDLAQNRTNPAVRQTIPEANQGTLKTVLKEFRRNLINSNSSELYLKTSQQLYQWLIDPVEPNIVSNQIDILIVSPDRDLRSLPMAALHDGKQFLIEKYGFALIPSFALTDTSLGNLKDLPMLAMGISKSTEGQAPLPAVEVEVNALSRDLWQGQGFLNEQMTLENLKNQSRQRQPGIIHLATHADFQTGELNNSYIQFWNSKLPLNQLRTLSKESGWNAVSMLVLSACRSALGNEQAELGFAGLAVQAGVKTGIGSLWKVSDQGSVALMTEFYTRLKTAPIKAEALRQAQLAMLKGEVGIVDGQLQLSNQKRFPLPPELTQENPKLAHPYFWSGFTVIGNWS